MMQGKYMGVVSDALNTLPDRKTKWYDTWAEAHSAAEKLCKKTMGDRGDLMVITKPKEVRT